MSAGNGRPSIGPSTIAGFKAPVADWLVLVAGAFHAMHARDAGDPAVIAMENVAGRIMIALEEAGLPKTALDQAIAALAVCEACGCAEHRACVDACHWLPEYLAAERFVCSACTGKVSGPEEPRYGPPRRLILPGDSAFGIRP